MELNPGNINNDKLENKELKTEIKKNDTKIVNSNPVINTNYRSGNTTIEEVDLSIYSTDSKK